MSDAIKVDSVLQVFLELRLIDLRIFNLQILQDRKAVLKNTIERSKKVMQMAMETAGEKKVKGQIFTISVQANPSSVVMDEQYLENIPEKYLIPQEPKLDRKKIAEDIKAGEDLNGIAHLEQTESLRIK